MNEITLSDVINIDTEILNILNSSNELITRILTLLMFIIIISIVMRIIK